MKLLVVIVTAFLSLSGCDRDETIPPAPPALAVSPPQVPTTTQASTAPRVVFLGDSLTAGLGLEADQAFPARVGALLDSEGVAAHVVNAGVSGDTTAGGLRRLDWLLRQKPDVVVIGLGGNDGLRGMELKASEENLRAIVRQSKGAGARVLLLGMLIPPNYGPEYTAQFRELYRRIATELDVPLVPFVLEGVGGDPRLNQPDGIHPTAQGQRIIAANVLPHLRPLVREMPATQPSGGAGSRG